MIVTSRPQVIIAAAQSCTVETKLLFSPNPLC